MFLGFGPLIKTKPMKKIRRLKHIRKTALVCSVWLRRGSNGSLPLRKRKADRAKLSRERRQQPRALAKEISTREMKKILHTECLRAGIRYLERL